MYDNLFELITKNKFKLEVKSKILSFIADFKEMMTSEIKNKNLDEVETILLKRKYSDDMRRGILDIYNTYYDKTNNIDEKQYIYEGINAINHSRISKYEEYTVEAFEKQFEQQKDVFISCDRIPMTFAKDPILWKDNLVFSYFRKLRIKLGDDFLQYILFYLSKYKSKFICIDTNKNEIESKGNVYNDLIPIYYDISNDKFIFKIKSCDKEYGIILYSIIKTGGNTLVIK